jgi:hypothetical protein
MPRFLKAARGFLTDQKDALPVNRYEGFTSNGAVVLRDRRGTSKAEIPDVDTKGITMGDDPLAIYKPTGAKSVDRPGLPAVSIRGLPQAGKDRTERRRLLRFFRRNDVKKTSRHIAAPVAFRLLGPPMRILDKGERRVALALRLDRGIMKFMATQ